MFTINESLTDLKVKERNIYKILYSMNSPQVATPELSVEEARCYVLFFSESQNLSAYIGLYLPRTDRKIFYVYTSNPFPFEAGPDVEVEATGFAEDMGFLLDEISVNGMALDDRNRWIEEQFIFGYKKPELEEVAEGDKDEEPVNPVAAAIEETVEAPPKKLPTPSIAPAEPVAASPMPAAQPISAPAPSPEPAQLVVPVLESAPEHRQQLQPELPQQPQPQPAPLQQQPPAQQPHYPPQQGQPFNQPQQPYGQQPPPLQQQPQYPPQQGQPFSQPQQPYGQPQPPLQQQPHYSPQQGQPFNQSPQPYGMPQPPYGQPQQPYGQPPHYPQQQGQPFGQPPQQYQTYPPQAPQQVQPAPVAYPPHQAPVEPPAPQQKKSTLPQAKAPAAKKKVQKSVPRPEPAETVEEEIPVETETAPTHQRPPSVFDEALKEGVVKPPKPKAAKAVRPAGGVVPRDREALARLLSSF